MKSLVARIHKTTVIVPIARILEISVAGLSLLLVKMPKGYQSERAIPE